MTFCKLVAGNVRRHLRDYGVYFLTLTLAVALFYAFNAVGEQQAFLELSMTKALLFEQMTALIRVLSVLIALVLGFLVLYANQFLLRRGQAPEPPKMGPDRLFCGDPLYFQGPLHNACIP